MEAMIRFTDTPYGAALSFTIIPSKFYSGKPIGIYSYESSIDRMSKVFMVKDQYKVYGTLEAALYSIGFEVDLFKKELFTQVSV